MKGRIKLLIADDDFDDVCFFEEAFKQLHINYNLISFADGRSTVDYLKTLNPADGLSPDLIVLDLNMPVLDGISVLEIVKNTENIKNIPVFMLTTSKSEEHRSRCKKLGCTEYYVKPIKINELVTIIRDILSKAA